MAKRPEIKIDPMDEFFGIPASIEGSAMVKIKDIYSFKDHPFKVLDDEKMDELVESIKANGVLSPVLVRPRTPEQGYEMISGHRRLHASKKAGLEYIPAIIKEMSDDEATIAMVDSNVQREEILPSERAWSFKMKMDAMNRQGARLDLEADGTCGTEFHKSDENSRKTRETIGSEAGMTGRQVQKYIRLTELIPPLLSMVASAQRMMKIVSLFSSKMIMQWNEEAIQCPICGGTDIEKIDSATWKCRNYECGVLFGKTKCADGCGNYYDWTRPSIDIDEEDLFVESELDRLLMKETIFDRLTVTDFDFVPYSGSKMKYIPKCPICGKRRENAV